MYSKKFSVIASVVGIFLTVVLWLFPDAGKILVSRMRGPVPPTVDVPGKNTIQRQINLAKIQDPEALNPSSEFVMAVPFARPSLSEKSSAFDSVGGIVALSNSSPLQSIDQDLVFSAGRCRFGGRIHLIDRERSVAQGAISVVSCILDNGDSYIYGESGGTPIGFLAQADTPTSREISLVQEGRVLTIALERRYMVRFFNPLRSINYQGKSAIRW